MWQRAWIVHEVVGDYYLSPTTHYSLLRSTWIVHEVAHFSSIHAGSRSHLVRVRDRDRVWVRVRVSRLARAPAKQAPLHASALAVDGDAWEERGQL